KMDRIADLIVNLTSNKKALLYTAGVGLGAIGFGLALKYSLKKRQKTLTRVGVVSQLLIYPIKSCKGVSAVRAECLEMGLKYGELKDRNWLVITEDGHQVTGRQEPRLVLISATCDSGHLCLNAPDMEELKIPLKQDKNNPVFNCRVWGSDIQGRDCGEVVSAWISRYLASGKIFRLVQFEPGMKPRRPCETEKLFRPHDKVVYPDVSPIMLLSETSVEDLNTRLERKVGIANFRPSIVVSGCEPYAEDSWKEIQIGSVSLYRVMACGRCMFVTVDPETGVFDRKEPLETLKSYRQCDPSEKSIYKTSPLFGQCYSVDKTGILQVGDPVYKITY
ncbi:MARC1 protein, partial [Atractosteus spatula]|nr:MARC1 protein [Atractosteus spatula]